MYGLENLVVSYEMAKKLHDDEFKDSIMGYNKCGHIEIRKMWEEYNPGMDSHEHLIPAPTVSEIMDTMEDTEELRIKHLDKDWWICQWGEGSILDVPKHGCGTTFPDALLALWIGEEEEI